MGLLRRRGTGGSDVDGFLPIIAPDNFISSTDYQYFGCNVNLYETFQIYKTNGGFHGKWIAEIYDNLNYTFSALTNTRRIYGETINGVDYVSGLLESGTNIFTTGSTNRWVMFYTNTTDADSASTLLQPSVKWIYIGGAIRDITVQSVATDNRGLRYIFTYQYLPYILQGSSLNYNSDSGFTHVLGTTFHVKGGLAFNTVSVRKLLNVTRLECDNIGFNGIPPANTNIGASIMDNCLNMSGDIVIAPTVTSIGTSSFFNCPLITSVKMQGNAPTLGNSNTLNLQTPAPIPLYLPTGATGYDTGIWADTTKFTQIRY